MTDNDAIYSLLPIHAGLMRHLSLGLNELGVDVDALLAKEGLSADTWLEGKQDVPALVIEKLLDHCLEHTGNELLGFHLAQCVKPEGFGVLGYIRQACQNLHDFILVCIRYEHLISGFGKTRLIKQPDCCLLSWSARTLNPIFERHATEFMLTAFNTTRSLLHNPRKPWLKEVRFRHAAPLSLNARRELEAHFECRVRFNQQESALVLAPDALNQPFLYADPALVDSLKQHAQSLEASKHEGDFYYRAHRMMRELIISQSASKENLATGLGISTRHLHRLLAKEHINYRGMQEQAQLTIAIEMLTGSSQTIETIGVALGYTESQSFIRWFKKQTGMTPNRYRESAQSRTL
ncbi:AraC family transcriptional regulator [Alcanivorax sediminis]|nr:AraC family transcriptional regulator [Alcanivorax sediminis]